MAELTVEQRRALALANARARAAKQEGANPKHERGALDRFARGFGGGLANLAGVPIGAAMEAGNLTGLTNFEDVSGANFIKRKLEPLGLTGAPGEDLGTAGAIGEGMGQYGTIGLGLTRGLAQRGAGLLAGGSRAPAGTAGARILDDMSIGAARAPVASGAAEMTAAGGEALGREMGEGTYGEDSWQKDVGGLIGGVIGGLAPSGAVSGASRAADVISDNVPVAGLVRRAGQRLFRVGPGQADRARASSRLREMAETAADPNDAIPALRNLRNTQDVDASLLTPAQQTGDTGIMSLAARERADDPKLLANWRSQVEDSMAHLRAQLNDVTGDELVAVQRRYGENIDDMAVVAIGNAERRLQGMTPNQRRSAASQTVSDELWDAMKLARREESALWNREELKNVVVPAETVRARYQQLVDSLPREKAEDLPLKAKQFLDPDSPDSYFRRLADDEAVETVPLERLQALRSALLDEVRNARSGATPNYNRARLARELANGLLEDMASVSARESPSTDALETALAFSRQLNDRFTRGPVGDLLQLSARGDARIAPELALDRSIGRGGVQAERTARAFKSALKSPSEEVRGAFTDYMKDEFRRKAMRGDQFNERGAAAFMAKYEDMLRDEPMLRSMFEQAIQDGNLASVGGRIQDGAARVLGTNNPAAEIRRIKNAAQADRTGAVWGSFRRGLTNELFERSRVRNPRGDIDSEIISGSALLEMLDGEKMGPALRQAYTKTELANLRRIANTAHRIERDIGARQASGFTTDEPNILARLLAGYSGALAGAAASRAAGGGAAGLRSAALGSSAAESLLRKSVRLPVSDLLHEAMKNKQVMDDLLAPVTKPGFESRVIPRVNAWLLAIGDEYEDREAGIDPEPERGSVPRYQQEMGVMP